MNREHVIPDELLEIIQLAINRNENWMAYNNSLYFIDKEDVHFFKEKNAAEEFASNNFSDHDHFNVIYIQSIVDVLKQIPYGEKLKELLSNLNVSKMNENNLKYLQDNIKYHGFGETLNPELEGQLQKGNAEFSLPFKAEVNKREMEATLHFKKSDTTDMYFFNKYDARTKNEKDETIAQTFYINKGSGVTLKEAYNLLNGRAVHKELTDKQDQKYTAWIQLDFNSKDKNGNYERKQFHQNYGYDLKEALSHYPIKELIKEDDMKSLVRSLEKGNIQMVTLEIPGKDVKVFIEANPQYKSVNLYNNKMQSLDKDQRQELMVTPEMKEDKGQNKRKEQKESLDGEDKAEKKQGKGRKVNGNPAGEDNGLVTKKRTGNKKGLGV